MAFFSIKKNVVGVFNYGKGTSFSAVCYLLACFSGQIKGHHSYMQPIEKAVIYCSRAIIFPNITKYPNKVGNPILVGLFLSNIGMGPIF